MIASISYLGQIERNHECQFIASYPVLVHTLESRTCRPRRLEVSILPVVWTAFRLVVVISLLRVRA